MITLSSKAMLHLLWNGPKAVEAVLAALDVGLLELLDEGPIVVGRAAARLGLVAGRLQKLLDCLETLGLVAREEEGAELILSRYRGVEPLAPLARSVIGQGSIERDRDRHPWRSIEGRLADVLRGSHAIPDDQFPWPPRTPEQIAGFEASMSLGCEALAESFVLARAATWGAGDGEVRLLDVGGGDGTLAARILDGEPQVRADVYNLPAVIPLVERRIAARADGRLGAVAGDFLAEPLPRGYDVLSFVRVLHDWPTEVARMLLEKAHDALPPGGRVLVCEELRDGDRLAAQFFWSWFLIGLDGCVSQLRARDFYLRAFAEAGFVDATVLEAPFPILAARKPG